jgi:hypothetical protein
MILSAGLSRGRNAFSPRVPVTIKNDADSRIATVSAAVTSTRGDFIVTRSRWISSRLVAQKFRMVRRNNLSYAGIGIAMLTLIENTVRLTIRHSDSEPIASAVATASISRDEATGIERLSKPAAPDDRFMAEFLRCAGESPATRNISQGSLATLRRSGLENGKMRARSAVMTAILAVQALAAIPAGSSTVSGCQSMVTKPRVCSIRRSQVRIAGNVARS